MIEVYTDGSCLGNPGPGGWAYIIDDFIGRGGAKVTTNNVMEMTAVISITLFVVTLAPPRPIKSSIIYAQPPGPGFPKQLPSV